jgi:hypothetical protein
VIKICEYYFSEYSSTCQIEAITVELNVATQQAYLGLLILP